MGTLLGWLIIASVQTKFERDSFWLPLIAITLLTLLWWIVRSIRQWDWYSTPFAAIILTWIGVIGLSAIANRNQFDRMASWGWYLGAGIGTWYILNDTLANREIQRETLIDSILIAGVPIVLAAYVQAWTLVTQGINILALPSQRIAGTLANPNNLAGFLAVLIPLLLVRLWIARRPLIRVMLIVYLVLSVLIMLSTDSRNGELSVIAGLSALFALRRGISLVRLAQISLFLLIVLALTIVFRHNDSRLDLYEATVQMFVAKPLTGWGLFNYQVALQTLYPQGIVPTGAYYYEAHNVLLQVAVELGLVGIAVLCVSVWIVGKTIFIRWRQTAGSERLWMMGGIAGIATMTTHGMFDNLTLTVPGMGIVLLMLLAVSVPVGARVVRRWNLMPVLVAALWIGLLLIAFVDRGTHLAYWALPDDPSRRVVLMFDTLSDSYTNQAGWYPPDLNPVGVTFQWTAAPDFSITLPLPKDSPILVQFRIVNSAAPDILGSLTLSVNNDPVNLLRQMDTEDFPVFKGIISQATLAKSGDLTSLDFHTARVISPKALGIGTDTRPLGLAFNWLRIEPTKPPVNALAIEFNGDEQPPLLGSGWNDPETSPTHITYRWSSADTFTLYPFLLTDRDLIIDFRVQEAIAPDVLASLKLAVNGDLIMLDSRSDGYGGTLFHGLIPHSSLAKSGGNLTILTFHTARVVVPKSVGLGSDNRSLGLAFDWLHITPANQAQ
ncbi:MAG: O-antigen ligase family protein [Aggregatilineales bacterium]